MGERDKYRILFLSRYAAESFFYSFLAVFLVDKGFDGSEIGLILSFSPLMLALSLPIWAGIDKARYRRILIIAAAAVLILLQYFLIISDAFPAVVTLCVLCSFVRAPFNPSIDGMTTLFSMENGYEYSSFRAFGSAGYLIAILGGAVIYDYTGFSVLYIMSAALFLVFIVTAFKLKPLVSDNAPAVKEHSFKILFSNRAFKIFMLYQIICFAVMSFVNSYETVYYKSRGMGMTVFGVSTLVRVGFEIAAFYFLRRKKMQLKLPLTVAPLLMIGQCVVFFFHASVYLLIPSVVFSGIASGTIIYLNNKYLSQIVRPRNLTIAFYVMLTIQNLSIAAFVLLGGFITDILGVKYVYCVGAGFYILASVFAAAFLGDWKKPIAVPVNY